MIEIKRKQIIPFVEKWLANNINLNDKYKFVHYLYTDINLQDLKGFKKEVSHTITIDLEKSEDEIFKSFHSKYRNEIKRANKEGIVFEVCDISELNIFKNKYNKFASKKQLVSISNEKFNAIKNNTVLTKTKYKNQVLNYHLYLVDSNTARLLYSIDIFHSNIERKYYGWSNKFLHHKDIVFFKNKGLNIYDFGGYAKDTTDKGLQGINSFKEKFGGDIIEQFSYTSFPYYFFLFTKRLIVATKKYVINFLKRYKSHAKKY